jgi:DNA (cytosine-5)-methyltransferase 1
MKVGSLFSGIGGIDLGLERAGMEVAWQVEVDPFCRQVLGMNFPGVTQHGDIHGVGSEELEPVELVCGGFPCVTTSQAGLRTGADDERWLWPEMWRVICELRPRFVLMENPTGLLSRGMGEVLGDLAEVGYDAEWEVISAAAVGADHVRDRVWVVAYPNGWGREVFRQQEPRRVFRESRRFPDRRCARWELEDAATLATHWKTEPEVGRVADGVQRRVDRLGALGRAAVPQVAEWIGKRIMESC